MASYNVHSLHDHWRRRTYEDSRRAIGYTRYVAPLNRVKAIVGVVTMDDTTGQQVGVRAFRPHINFTYSGKGKSLVSDYDIALVTLVYYFEESSMMKTVPYVMFTIQSLQSYFFSTVKSNKCVTIGYGTSSGKRIKQLMVLNMIVLPQEGCKIPTEEKGSVICCKPESNAIKFGHSGSPLVCGGMVFGLFKVYYNYTLDGKEIVAYTYTAVWPFLDYLEVRIRRQQKESSAMKISPVFICQLLAIAFAGFMNCTNLTFNRLM
ncbi:uncharacterized protein LOC106664575 [Cimex lectularius]|uniref:Peptidase S1 domain-containing protein n=1 Tax=Cimex lectularius TaxID=79782 RepID=A0A8I6RI68_CIMLE|nr:uncharacterized protein LOC106664575 [Cimex lectularius]